MKSLQTNLIARIFEFAQVNNLSAEVLMAATVFKTFPGVEAQEITAQDRQRYWTLLAQAQQFHGAHSYRDSEDDYERDLWSTRNTQLDNTMALIYSVYGAADLRTTLLDAQCWLTETLEVNSNDTVLSASIAKLIKSVKAEVVKLYK